MTNKSKINENERKKRGEERQHPNDGWPTLQRLQIKAKSRLMVNEGKQVQVNHWLDNKKKKKKAIALLLPLRFPDTQTDDKHFQKALNKGLHDESVHIKT